MKTLLFIISTFISISLYAESTTSSAIKDAVDMRKSGDEIKNADVSTQSRKKKKKKKKKIKNPVVVKYNSEYDLMVYIEDFEGIYTWDEGIKASEDLVAFGFDDWYMPTKEELAVMYANMEIIGNFIKATYWCSSEPYQKGGNLANFHNFYDGSNAYYPKAMKRKVRCVRKVNLK